MSPAPTRIEATLRRVDTEERVTPLELFFDLVFVLAISQVTSLIFDDPTWRGLGQGLAVLAVLWWGWVGYAWLTNVVNPEEGAIRLVVLAAMAAMFVAALAAPHAFGDDGVLFAGAYLFVRAAHIALFLIGSREDPAQRRSTLLLAASSFPAVALLIGAGFADGSLQAALWGLALVIDYGGPLLVGIEGWHVFPAHFAERHGLIVIIALGETIVATAIGASHKQLDAGLVSAALLTMIASFCMWWAYFDVVAIVATRKLSDARNRARNAMARDSYSYLHLPMVAGITLFAFGVKETMAHGSEPLGDIAAIGLCGGFAIYLLAHIAFRFRNVGSLNRHRSVATLVVLAVLPVAIETGIPALAVLSCVTAIAAGLITYEAIRFSEPRARLRASL